MKTIFLSLVTSIFMILSLNTFADTVTKMTISGEPVVVTKSGNFYTLPGSTTYTTTSDYYYINADGTKEVCYRDVQSTFAGINPSDLSLKIGNDIVSVHCYTYSPDYFIVK